MITGEAAGTAAALCVGKKVAVRDLPFARIKEALLAQGVLL
jgi:hypothetical protein